MDAKASTLSCRYPIRPNPDGLSDCEARMAFTPDLAEGFVRRKASILSTSAMPVKASDKVASSSATTPSITVSPRRRVDDNLFVSPVECPCVQAQRLSMSDLTEWMASTCIQRDMLEEYTRHGPFPAVVEVNHPEMAPRVSGSGATSARGPVLVPSIRKASTRGDNTRSALSARGSPTAQLKRRVNSWKPYSKSELGSPTQSSEDDANC